MSNFGTVVGERSPEGREEFLRYYKAAIDILSPSISLIEFISRETGVFLVVGVVERDEGTLYCTAVLISPGEGYLSKHRNGEIDLGSRGRDNFASLGCRIQIIKRWGGHREDEDLGCDLLMVSAFIKEV